MTIQQEHHQNQDEQTLAIDTYVFDVSAMAVGRIADPSAYPREYLGAAVALVVPLAGEGPPWQAIPGCLRPAEAEEIREATR